MPSRTIALHHDAFPLAAFGPVDWAIVVLYLAGMVVIGHVVGRRKTDAEGYFLAGRSTPMWAVILSTMATTLSAATFLGAPELSFKGDLSYFVLNIGGFIAVLVVAAVFIPCFYRAGTVTIYGYINQRFGEPSRIACSAMFLLGRMLASGARLFIAATPVCLLLFRESSPRNGQLVLAILLIGAIGIAYTTAGGIKAVIWTDTAQILIVMGAAVLSVYLLLHRIPLSVGQIIDQLARPIPGSNGVSKLHWLDTSLDPAKSFTLWTALLASTLVNTASYGVDHDLVQRMLTAKSALRGSVSLVLSQVFGMLVLALFLTIGLLLYIYYGRPDLMGSAMPTDTVSVTREVYPRFLLSLHSGFAGLAMAGLFAAAQGSLDSAINAMASSAVADLYWPLKARLGHAVDKTAKSKAPKLAVAGMGAALIAFACGCVLLFDGKSNTLIEFALGIMAFAYTGMLGVFLTALLTPRGNTRSVIAALLVGIVVTAVMQDRAYTWWTRHLFGGEHHISNLWAMPVGTPICFLICWAGKAESRPIAAA